MSGGAQDLQKKKNDKKTNTNKKSKEILSESNSENEVTKFPRVIVFESWEENLLAKLSPFLIEKIVSSRANLLTVKKFRSSNLLVEVDYKNIPKTLIKMKD